MKILLVEDSDMVAKGLIYSLEQNGYDVIHKTTEKETITAVFPGRIFRSRIKP